MFEKLLIANRGEIAIRIATTARRLGIRTMGVYSEADARSAHVAACDEAVCIGPAPAKDSYLNNYPIITTALGYGASAIHPGYGFLSENENFARICEFAKIAFVGPPSSAIRAMGNKSAAKALMEKANVPVVPGYHGTDQSTATLEAEAKRIGFPILIKAAAGGGGKGMRIVHDAASFPEALSGCQREAQNSFNDSTVLLERYLTRPRHIEMQIFADNHGNCLYLFERDCSVQRRYQKVLEEAPAPGMTPERRKAMGEAAVAAARAVNYRGAGTVEFIAQDGEFYFMEMNTRLQVEHPVTEMILGLDLVEWQLRVAAGEALPVCQSDLRPRGHAIEARLYAENPDKGFLPAIGPITHLHFPPHLAFTVGSQQKPTIRIDSGVRAGDAISPYYDPLIAKVIAWAETREQALRVLAEALAKTIVAPLTTNLNFLRRILRIPDFVNANLDTSLIARNQAKLLPPPAPPPPYALALAIAGILTAERSASTDDPWSALPHFRLLQPARREFEFTTGKVTLTLEGNKSTLTFGDKDVVAFEILSKEGDLLRIQYGEDMVDGSVYIFGEAIQLFTPLGAQYLIELPSIEHLAVAHDAGGGLVAPMPGKIVALLVEIGVPVAKGTPLLVMEAMKMEHTITAPSDGKVTAFRYRPGAQVTEGTPLLDFESASS